MNIFSKFRSIFIDPWLKSGGHVVENHIAKSDEYLLMRFFSGRIDSSTFDSAKIALECIHQNLATNRGDIADWLANSMRPTKRFTIPVPGSVGRGIVGPGVSSIGPPAPMQITGMLIVLERTSSDSYLLLKAYPTGRNRLSAYPPHPTNIKEDFPELSEYLDTLGCYWYDHYSDLASALLRELGAWGSDSEPVLAEMRQLLPTFETYADDVLEAINTYNMSHDELKKALVDGFMGLG